MARSELVIAISHLAAERNLPREVIIAAVEDALVSAYKRRHKGEHDLSAGIDMQTGAMRVFALKEVVEEVSRPEVEISLAAARKIVPNANLHDQVKVDVTPAGFGRIAAQAAKQTILSRIREAERDVVMAEYQDRVGEIVQGRVQRVDKKRGPVTILLRRGEAILPAREQIPHERFRPGRSVKAYLLDLKEVGQAVQIILSRAHRDFLRRLMEQEVPEIKNGLIEIRAIAREPGSRSKVAVVALQPKIDPVGSCVGMRGMRIQNVVNELNGEKIDVVEWNNDPHKYIANALSPASVNDVILQEQNGVKTATVIVPNDQLSLAIGKEGQNARLAARLTGWRVDIKSEKDALAEGLDQETRDRLRMQYASQKAESDLLSRAEALLHHEAPHGELETALLGIALGDAKQNDDLWRAAQEAVQEEEPAEANLPRVDKEPPADSGTLAPMPESAAEPKEKTEEDVEEEQGEPPVQPSWDIKIPDSTPTYFGGDDVDVEKETKRKKKGKKRRSHKSWDDEY